MIKKILRFLFFCPVPDRTLTTLSGLSDTNGSFSPPSFFHGKIYTDWQFRCTYWAIIPFNWLIFLFLWGKSWWFNLRLEEIPFRKEAYNEGFKRGFLLAKKSCELKFHLGELEKWFKVSKEEKKSKNE